MSEMNRDEVLNYRPGPDSERPLDDGETVQVTFTADRARYWKDHAAMAALGSVAIVMHPGPMNRGVEIDGEIADDINRSVIQDQVEMGVAVRMAAMDLLARNLRAERGRQAVGVMV